jgi:hypothetical protein
MDIYACVYIKFFLVLFFFFRIMHSAVGKRQKYIYIYIFDVPKILLDIPKMACAD